MNYIIGGFDKSKRLGKEGYTLDSQTAEQPCTKVAGLATKKRKKLKSDTPGLNDRGYKGVILTGHYSKFTGE